MLQASDVRSAKAISRIMDSDVNTTLRCNLSDCYYDRFHTHIRIHLWVKGTDENALAIGAIVRDAITDGQLYEDEPPLSEAHMRRRLEADHRPEFDGMNLIRRV